MKLDKIEVDSVVSIHYSLSLDGGEQIDSSQGSAPLDYLHGHDNIVPGLEEELTGRQVGDKLSVAVPPEKGYGVHDPDGVQELPRATFPDELELQPNVMLQGQDAQGQPVQLRVVDVSDETVKVDLNHPLAGHNLNFEVEIMGIRTATQEELAHGHVHGPGGHDH